MFNFFSNLIKKQTHLISCNFSKEFLIVFILFFILGIQLGYAQTKEVPNTNLSLDQVKGINSQLQLLGEKFENLRKDYENSFKVLVKLTDINAHSAQFVIWLITVIVGGCGILSYIGILSMKNKADATINKLKDECNSLICKTKDSLDEINASKKQLEELKQYLTLGSQLKEITTEKIDQQISSAIKNQVHDIDDKLKKLRAEDLPKNADIYSKIGLVYLRGGDYLSAVDSYKKALEINPNARDARFGLARTYAKIKGYRKDAIKEYEILLNIYPDFIAGIENLAELYLMDGEYIKFDESLRRVFANSDIVKAFRKEDFNILEFLRLCSLALKKDSGFELEFNKFIGRIKTQGNPPYISKSWIFDINTTLLESKLIPDIYNKIIALEKLLSGQ